MERPDSDALNRWPIVLGVDVGQRRDPTAIAVAEVARLPTGRMIEHAYAPEHFSTMAASSWATPELETVFLVRAVARLPLGTPYPSVARTVAETVRRLREADEAAAKDAPLYAPTKPRRVEVRLDSTGVGRPIVDLLASELVGLRVMLRAVTFAAGERLERRGGEWTVGKLYLAARLAALLQTGRIRAAAGMADLDALLGELRDYEVRTSSSGFSLGAFRRDAHDDLATALALAVPADPEGEARLVPLPAGWA